MSDASKSDKEPIKRLDVDMKVLDALLQFKPTKSFCADYLKVSEDTIERRIREVSGGLTFGEYREKKMEGVKVKLQSKALEMALGGHGVLLIFCLKNLCGWADKNETAITDGKNVIQLNYNLEKKL